MELKPITASMSLRPFSPLIVPYGIETMDCLMFRHLHESSNRTLWN